MDASTPARAASMRFMVSVAGLAIATAAIGTAATVLVPRGLPYDEPAHWANVLFYAGRGELPVLGEPGVQYEAQQTPLYYIVGAIIVRLLHGTDAAFLALRLFGVVGMVALTVLTAAILRSAIPRPSIVALTGTAFIGLNPMLIVMSASVQNDTWSLVAGLGALLMAMAENARHPLWRGIAIGLLGATAILVKISIAPLVIAIVIVLLCRSRFVEASASISVILVGCGWWVVRNLMLYGDLTGQAGVDAAGFHFGRGGLGAVALAREMLTYLTLPTEYLRNTISSPLWLDVIVLIIASVMVVGFVMLGTRTRVLLRPGPTWIVVIVGLASIGAWFAQVMFGWQVAFRTAYGALPLVALGFGAATLVARGRRGRWALGAVFVGLVIVTTAWTAVALLLGEPHAMLSV
jgi:D-alanyl-D-alanine carboxypeptidase (penicillin-binding protein 5/6)